VATIDNLSIQIEGSADKLSESLGKLEAILARLASSSRRLQGIANRGTRSMGEMAQEAKDAGNDTQESGKQIGEATNKIRGLGDASMRSVSGISGFWQAMKNVGSFGKSAFKAISFLPKVFGGQLIDSIKNAGQKVGFFFSQIKRVAMYRLIRTAIKFITQSFQEGMKNLYAWSSAVNGEFAKSMDTLTTASKYAGNSLAAMASPLINAISPAIDFVVDKLVDMFNVINQIIARLTGQTSYTAAKKVASQWQEASDSAAGSARHAADEIKRTILGFDEINKLNGDNKSTGGSGSGSGLDNAASNMFETRPIEGSVSSFADQLKSAFENANWKELGTTLGEKINELVGKINFADAGKKVGEAINGWFTTKYWTLETINFTNIGNKIAEFLNNGLKEIDFETIGRAMVQKMTIIGDLIIGFFTDFDWGQAAEKLSDFVKGIYNQLTDWFKKYDWGDLGLTLYNKIKDALTNFDFNGIVQSFFELLGSAARAAISLGAGFVAGLWTDIAAWWSENITADTFTETVHNILDAIGQGFSNIGQWVWDNILNPFMAALTGNENWASDLLKFGANIWDSICEGVTNAIASIETWWKTNVVPIVVDAIEKAGFAWERLKEFGKNIWDSVCEGIKTAISSVGTWIKEHIFDKFLEKFKAAFGIQSPAATMIDPGKEIMNGVLKGISNVMSTIAQWIIDNIFNVFTAAFKLTQEVIDALMYIGGDIIGFVLKGILAVMGGIVKWVADNIIKPLVDAFKQDDEEVQGDDFSSKLWDAIKSKWTSSDKKLTVNLEANKTAMDLWDAIKKEWNKESRTLPIGIIKAWKDDAVSWLGLNNLSATALINVKLAQTATNVWHDFKREWDKDSRAVQVGIVKAWNGDAISWLQLDNLKADISMSINLEKTASEIWIDFKREWNKDSRVVQIGIVKAWKDDAVSWLQLDKLKASVSVKLVKTWTLPPIQALGLKNLSSKVAMSMVKTWRNTTLKWLGLDGLKSSVAMSMVKTWKTTVLKALGLNNLQAKVSITLERKGWTTVEKYVDGSFGGATGGGGKTAGGGGGRGGRSYPVSVSLEKGWSGTPTSAVGLDGMNSTATVDLTQGWVGSPTGAVGLNNLESDTRIGLIQNWIGSALDWLGLSNLTTTVKAELQIDKNKKKIVLRSDAHDANTWTLETQALGGIFESGKWSKIPQYAGGTMNAATHGSLFLAGEAGPEIVGHVGGRTEVLNKSQLAAAMYSAVHSAMSGVSLEANVYTGGGNDGSDYDTMYSAMYDAFTAAMARSDERDREKVQLMREIASKEFTAEVTANSMAQGMTRMNRRAGTTVVPVGT
jgi:hypothetical protein